MPRILLIDPDHTHVSDLAGALNHRGYSVIVCEASLDIVDQLRQEEVARFDLAIVNMTANRPIDWRVLEGLCRLSATHTAMPKVLALSRAYRGPQMRWAVERMGGQMVYER